jgi:hypothetical protein
VSCFSNSEWPPTFFGVVESYHQLMAAEQAFLGVLDFDENLLRFYVPLRGQMRTGFCDTQL